MSTPINGSEIIKSISEDLSLNFKDLSNLEASEVDKIIEGIDAKVNKLVDYLLKNPEEVHKTDSKLKELATNLGAKGYESLGNRIGHVVSSNLKIMEEEEPELPTVILPQERNPIRIHNLVANKIAPYLNPVESRLLSRSSKGFRAIPDKIRIDLINSNTPIRELGLSKDELLNLIVRFGRRIRCLDLSGIKLPNPTVLIKFCPNLTHLSLRGCNVTEKGAKFMAPELGKLTNLIELDLSENELFPAGAESLAPEIGKLVKLEKLSLANTYIINRGVRAIAPELGKLVNLRELDLSNLSVNET
jgi:Leucine-rich repeat (LRR) protein